MFPPEEKILMLYHALTFSDSQAISRQTHRAIAKRSLATHV